MYQIVHHTLRRHNRGAFRTFYFSEILRVCLYETRILRSISDMLRESQRFSDK